MQTFDLISETVKNCIEALAVLVGGGWAFYQFVLRRESKPALGLALHYRVVPKEQPSGLFLVSFDIIVTNKSTCRVTARVREADKPAFEDESETLKHSCSLLLRRITTKEEDNEQVRWFPTAQATSPLSSDVVVNLLDEYEYEGEGMPDFWMEPSEKYHLCVGVVLKPGVYLAMLTFVGQYSDDEFWRRLFIIHIKEPETTLDKTASESAEASPVPPP